MNRLIIGLIIFSLTFSTHAGVISDELKKLGASFSENFASSDAGSFVSKSRSGVSGGSLRKRIQRTVVTPISITPPKITTGGCAGIDIHFGSFSFINGDQIRQLLSSYLQGAVGLAFTMAIDQGCPECGKAMDKLSEWANYANGLNLDSCQMAQSTMDAIFDEKNEACASLSADSGDTTDRGESKEIGGNCGSDKSPAQIAEELDDQLTCESAEGNPLTGDALAKCEQNRTKLLKLWGNTTVYFLMQSGGISSEAAGWDDHDFWKAALYTSTIGSTIDASWVGPTMTPIDVLEGALCGTDPIPSIASAGGDIEETVLTELHAQCDAFISKVNASDNPLEVTTCGTIGCREGAPETFADWVGGNQNLVGTGFPFSKLGLLRTVGNAIISMQNKSKTGSTAFSEYERYLLSTAPFPLYRLINVSAFYPEAASQLIGKNTSLLAFEYARGITDSFFAGVLSSRSLIPDDEQGRIMLPQDLSEEIRNRAREYTFDSEHYATKDDAAYRMNTMLVQQILMLEKSLLQSNLNKGLNGLGIN